MTEFVIFGSNVTRADGESFFFQLSSEGTFGLSSVRPLGIKIAEVLSMGSPMAVIDFIDGNGDFINHNKIDPNVTFYLDIGDSMGNSIRLPLNISKVTLGNLSPGESRNVQFAIHFVHSGWFEMMGKRRNRSWSNKRIDEIISEIAGECGFKSVDVTETDTIYESTIQPSWTNLFFMKWLKSRAYPKNKDKGHFEFGIRCDGDFFFKSIGDILEENKSAIDNNQVTTLFLGGMEENNTLRKMEIEENNSVPVFFVSYVGTERYIDGLVNGAGGIRSSHFDFETGKYITTVNNTSDTNLIQISDWTGIPSDFEGIDKKSHHGRNTDSTKLDEISISNVMNSLQEFDVVMQGSPFIHIGQVVEVLIPTNPNIETGDGRNSISPFSEFYSGFYIISAVNHTASLVKSTMNTTLSLSRSGFDGKDLGGFVKTKRGRFV